MGPDDLRAIGAGPGYCFSDKEAVDRSAVREAMQVKEDKWHRPPARFTNT